VICDRFLDSSLAYQGDARGLGVDEVLELNRWALGGLLPDITVLLEVEPDVVAGRPGQSDRIEAEGPELQHRVAEAYERLAEAEPSRFVRVRGDREAQEVHADVLAAVEAVRAGASA
jgi:dTMP kinase